MTSTLSNKVKEVAISDPVFVNICGGIGMWPQFHRLESESKWLKSLKKEKEMYKWALYYELCHFARRADIPVTIYYTKAT